MSLQTADFHAGYMCNYEVLSIMRAQHEERQAQIKALGERRPKRATKAQRDQDDEEAERIQPQELHTVTFEVSKGTRPCLPFLHSPLTFFFFLSL